MQDVSPPGDLKKLVSLLLTLVIGAAISIGVFWWFHHQESSRLQADFESMSADRAQAIRTAVEEDKIELGLISDYASASSELSRGDLAGFTQEFARLARRISLREGEMQIFAFLAALPSTDRPAFEALIRKSVDAEFQVREVSPAGPLQRAADRSRYFPVAVTEPEQFSGGLLGLDVLSVPELRKALDHAIASGKPTASEAIEIPVSESGSRVVWTFLPVRRSARVSDPAASRTGLLGVCAIASRVDQMVDRALGPLSPAGIDLELRDGGSPGLQKMYYHHSRIPGASVIKNGDQKGFEIDAGEHKWTLLAYSTNAFTDRHRSRESWIALVAGLLLTGLSGIIFWGRLRHTEQVEEEVAARAQELAEEISKHEALERALAESRAALTAQVSQLNEQNKQVQLLTDVGEALQSCLTTEEACATISLQAPRLLPGTSGTLFIHDSMKGLFLDAAEWGPHPSVIPAFKAEDCWALRRGRPHAVSTPGTNLSCPHASGIPDPRSLCLPLSAGGRTIGLLQVTGAGEGAHTFAESVAEHVGLALSNIMLRSDLRQLSIHDPLTGLFNRRYMEEALETEIRRAERKKQPIGVIMMDIDHFKAFNDGFGHAAGDQMLRAIAVLVQARLRASDIACRFGGEEMVLILPEATADAARHRAEDLRSAAKGLEVKHDERPLGQVTVSLGVAVYPNHGVTSDQLLAAADSALYEAKEAGRDRVVVVEQAPVD